MTKILLFTNKDGGVSELFPSPMDLREGETEDEHLMRLYILCQRSGFATPGTDRIVQKADLPNDDFRNAWERSADGGAQVNMPMARDIHRDRLRELRTSKLKALDVAWFKAMEAGDTKTAAAIAAQKQALRDVTADPAIEAALTPKQLKAFVPAELASPAAGSADIQPPSA